MLSSIYDVTDIMVVQMSTAATALTADGLEAAVNSALLELQWSLPMTDPTKSMWIIKRSVRHACYILWVASAQKFKYKQVNLQQRFEHYEKLIANMDKEFESALTTDSFLFAGVSSFQMFGTAIGPGFVYDSNGVDLTYLTNLGD